MTVIINNETASQLIENAMNTGMLLWVSTSAWGNRTKISEDILESKFGTDADIVRAVHDIIDPEFVRSITVWQSRAKVFASKRAMPWIHRGFFFIPECNIEDVNDYLEVCLEKIKDNVDVLAENIDRLYREACLKHPELVTNEVHVPSATEILGKFGLSFGWVKLTYPMGDGSKVGVVNKELVDRENTKFIENIKGVGEEYIRTMRKAFGSMLVHLVDVLKDPSKKFHESTIEKPKEFLRQLAEIKMPFNDTPFQEFADDLSNVLDGVYAEDVRDDSEYREVMSATMERMTEEFKSLPTVKIERALDI
jgi:hypothetical protein